MGFVKQSANLSPGLGPFGKYLMTIFYTMARW